MLGWLEEYYKHSALNFGQALQGVRYLYSHPDVDSVASRGSPTHLTRSLLLRSKRVANDLFFAVIPPRWHHTPRQLNAMRGISAAQWFRYGYCAWRFTNDGEVKTDLSKADRRWDPRCRNVSP